MITANFIIILFLSSISNFFMKHTGVKNMYDNLTRTNLEFAYREAEKRIEQLEQKLEIERSSRIALVNKIAELEKENAELKADKPKWHDLRKDPNDLPESYMSVVNQDGEKVMYDYSYKAWRHDDVDEYFCDTPIAWFEIPIYMDE